MNNVDSNSWDLYTKDAKPQARNCGERIWKYTLDINLDVGSVFLDMSKGFHKVWHKGLLFKLRQNGINGKLLLLLKSYLGNRI